MGNTQADQAPPRDCHEALVCAVKARDVPGVIRSLKDGADPNARCNYLIYKDNPVLSCAICKGYTDVVKALLEAKNINVNASGTGFHTALHEAASMSNKEVVELLLSRGADPNLRSGWIFKSSPLKAAAGSGCLDACRLLLQHGANIEFKTSEPLVAAAENGHMETCCLLLKHGSNINPTGKSPLAAAAEKGQLEICRFLLKHNANLNPQSNSPLVCAAKNGHLKICRLLLLNGANVSPCGTPPLVAAAENNHLEVCSLLLIGGANPDATDRKGCTAADIATEKGHIKLANWLCDQPKIIEVKPRSLYLIIFLQLFVIIYLIL